jgi:hypothetical protein
MRGTLCSQVFITIIEGFIGEALALFFNWGGVCIDKFNVASPGAIWAEFIAGGKVDNDF